MINRLALSWSFVNDMNDIINDIIEEICLFYFLNSYEYKHVNEEPQSIHIHTKASPMRS